MSDDLHVHIVVLESSDNPSDPFCRSTHSDIVGVYATRERALRRAESLAGPYVSVTVEDRIVS